MFKNKLNSAKDHVVRNKAVYISATVGVFAGAAGTLFVIQKTALVSNRNIQVLTYKSNQTLEVFIEALGDPGNIVQDTTTGNIYASQRQAARALGVSPSSVSQHLNGHSDHVDGHILTKLGKAMISSQ